MLGQTEPRSFPAAQWPRPPGRCPNRSAGPSPQTGTGGAKFTQSRTGNSTERRERSLTSRTSLARRVKSRFAYQSPRAVLDRAGSSSDSRETRRSIFCVPLTTTITRQSGPPNVQMSRAPRRRDGTDGRARRMNSAPSMTWKVTRVSEPRWRWATRSHAVPCPVPVPSSRNRPADFDAARTLRNHVEAQRLNVAEDRL